MFFPVQKDFLIERWKKFNFISLEKYVGMKFKRAAKRIFN